MRADARAMGHEPCFDAERKLDAMPSEGMPRTCACDMNMRMYVLACAWACPCTMYMYTGIGTAAICRQRAEGDG